MVRNSRRHTFSHDEAHLYTSDALPSSPFTLGASRVLNTKRKLSHCMTKPTKWHVRPAKIRISWTCHFVGFVMRLLKCWYPKATLDGIFGYPFPRLCAFCGYMKTKHHISKFMPLKKFSMVSFFRSNESCKNVVSSNHTLESGLYWPCNKFTNWTSSFSMCQYGAISWFSGSDFNSPLHSQFFQEHLHLFSK